MAYRILVTGFHPFEIDSSQFEIDITNIIKKEGIVVVDTRSSSAY
jgi:hypothetical protein